MKTRSKRTLATIAAATMLVTGLAVVGAPSIGQATESIKSQTLSKIDANLSSLDRQAGELGGQVSEVNGEILKLEAEYHKLVPKKERMEKLFRDTVRESYITGQPSEVEVIGANQTFSGVVSQQHYSEEIQVKTDRVAKDLQTITDQINQKLSAAKEKQQGLLALKGQLDERIATAKAQEAARQAAAAMSEQQLRKAQAANERTEAEGIAGGGDSPAPSPGRAPSYIGGGNGNPYPYGQCTWYVYSVTGRGQNGNAGTWAPSSSTPGVGKIMIWYPGEQGASGAGHVGVVIGVKGNRVQIRHMNWTGGPGVVSTGWFSSTGKFY
ncbi:MAG: CHAP domain-containing protein [bacterium]|nr:CHAP domain-containing protein [bacterium]MDZ4247868.1 CHAP domain-containing protein [Patescibacteria group bacterium]